MKKLMLLCLLVLLVVPMTTALDFDNVREYNPIENEITITNFLGLGDEIARVKLDTPQEVFVIAGKDRLVAEFTITNWEDYSGAFDSMEFYDIKEDMGEIDREFVYKYKEWYYEDRENWTTECIDNKGSIDCTNYYNGIYSYKNYEWTSFDKEAIVQKGNITIGIFTDVQRGESIEWIPTLFGERIPEWAQWTESLNTNLSAYWKLDGSLGGVLDSVAQNHNGTNVGATRGIAGKIGNAFNFSGGDMVNITNSSGGLNISAEDNYSITTWVKCPIVNTTKKHPIGLGESASSDIWLRVQSGSTTFVMRDSGSDLVQPSGKRILADTWAYLVVTYDGVAKNASLFINGTFEDSDANVAVNGNLGLANDWVIGRGETIANFDCEIDEIGFWSRELSATEVTQLYNGGAGITFTDTFGIDLNTTLLSPGNNTPTGDPNIEFRVNSSINVGNLTNTTLNVWWPNGTLIGINTTIITGTLNFTNASIATGIPVADNLLWNFESCAENVTLSECSFASPNRTINLKSFTQGAYTFNTSSFETASETFVVNMTTNGSVPTNAKLIYNGTSNTATITSQGSDNYSISDTIDIPTINGTKSFYFNFTMDGTEQSTTSQNQLINVTNMSFCNSGNIFVNVSFLNETVAQENITATGQFVWNYWSGSGDFFKTVSYSNLTENIGYSFCVDRTDNRTIQANGTITYNNDISEQRVFSGDIALSNATNLTQLFLLPTVDGVYVTFQVVNVAEQVLSGVSTNATRDGAIIESKLTDDAGLATYFLDPDIKYVFNFWKEGFDVATTSLFPSQSQFTITLGTTTTVQNDSTKGISYRILPTLATLTNGTDITFNLTLSSDFWDLDSFGFELKNSTGDSFNITSSAVGTGGSLERVLSTDFNNTVNIQMEVFWVIDGNYTNVTRTWYVIDDSDEGFSIANLFNDLSTYLTSGLFGLTPFGLSLIVFIVITFITGIMSFKFGVTGGTSISFIVFILVALFDVGLGLIATPAGAIPNIATIVVGVIFLGFLVRAGTI